jgi:hypothetical protein
VRHQRGRLARGLLVVLLTAACATVRPGTPVLPEDTTAAHAQVFVFNVSRGTMIPFRRYVDIDGFPMVRLWRETWKRVLVKPGEHELVMDGQRVYLSTVDGGVYYVAVGYHPRRTWLLPAGAHPIFVRHISEADAMRLFTEMKQAR